MASGELHIRTPLLVSAPLSAKLAATVRLKMEALQPSGSFKLRGIGHACRAYAAGGARRLVCSSGGNAGIAVAWAGRRLALPVTVVVPETTSPRAIEMIRQQAARVLVHGASWQEAHLFSQQLCKSESDSAYIHPFDDPLLWTGHATLIDEVVRDGATPDAVVLSVGGGGLLCGVVEGLRRNGLADVPVLAVETAGADSLAASVRAGRHAALEAIRSVATSLGAKKVAAAAWSVYQTHPVTSHVVSDRKAVDACLRFATDHRILVEPACGATLAAVYDPPECLGDKSDILVIVCGGAGVTAEQLCSWQRAAFPDDGPAA